MLGLSLGLGMQGPAYTLAKLLPGNLLANPVADQDAGWSSANGAGTATDLTLNALGLFDGVQMASGGAIWHRLNHTTEPTIASGTTYFCTVFVQFGTSGFAMTTLRNTTGGTESRFRINTAGTVDQTAGGAGAISDQDISAYIGDTYRITFTYVPNFSTGLSFGIGPGSTTSGENVIVLGAGLTT